MKTILWKTLLFMGLILFIAPRIYADDSHHGSIFSGNDYNLSASHFTWGVDLGSSIDLTANNFSTFDAEANLGYKNSFFRLAGIGVGIHKAFGSGYMFVPIFGILRTSFRKKPSPVFLNLQAGYSFNTIENSSTRGGFNMCAGVGINLAQSKNFKSHVIVGYGFYHINRRQVLNSDLGNSNISLAKIAIGVNF